MLKFWLLMKDPLLDLDFAFVVLGFNISSFEILKSSILNEIGWVSSVLGLK
jgi:hypothetical protein